MTFFLLQLCSKYIRTRQIRYSAATNKCRNMLCESINVFSYRLQKVDISAVICRNIRSRIMYAIEKTRLRYTKYNCVVSIRFGHTRSVFWR